MTRVIIESPYAGDIKANLAYARKCVHHSLMCDEAPLASHLIYTQPDILDDTDPHEREQGIEAGLAWYAVAELCVVYWDRGVSQGMTRAQALGIPIIFRAIEVDNNFPF